MCAGATVWNVLTLNDIHPGDRVGVFGIGGLGHLAIKLGAALGYHMIAISSSKSKHEESLELGASEFHVLHQIAGDVFKPLRHLILCGKPTIDYQRYMISRSNFRGTWI